MLDAHLTLSQRFLCSAPTAKINKQNKQHSFSERAIAITILNPFSEISLFLGHKPLRDNQYLLHMLWWRQGNGDGEGGCQGV